MNDRRLSIALRDADLNNPDTFGQLAVEHILAPCRRMWGLPSPRPGDDENLATWTDVADISPVHLDPVLRGLVLFAGLCPWAIHRTLDEIAVRPAAHFVDRSLDVAFRGHDEFRSFFEGLLAEPPADRRLNWAMPEPWPNPDAVADLRRAQELVRAALAGGESWEMSIGIDTGLTRMDWKTWNDLDAILRSDVHRRAIFIGSVDPILPEETPDGQGGIFAKDGGVTSTDVPETILGVVVLDLMEALAEADQRPGLCSLCGRPLLLSNSEASAARSGRPVYHGTCRNQLDIAAILTIEQRAANA